MTARTSRLRSMPSALKVPTSGSQLSMARLSSGKAQLPVRAAQPGEGRPSWRPAPGPLTRASRCRGAGTNAS